MENKQFLELIEKRKNWVKISQENKFDVNNILAGLYNDPSHFIFELLQNAEDEGAKKIRIELSKDYFDFYHDGKDFDIQDIDGITGIGISKKKDELNLIGKFGVGFKSVYAITKTPQIYSGEYRLGIKDFVIPQLLNEKPETHREGTLIRLPFNHTSRTGEEIFNLILGKLQDLDLKILLFLKNIKEIEWETPSSKGHYRRSWESVSGKSNVKKVTLSSLKGCEEYLVIDKQIMIGNNELKIEVAYKLKKENGEEIIIPEPNSKLVVFFPTEKVTFLNFIIQGPYRTTPNRENIPLDEEQNKMIVKETGILIAESLNIIKELGYLNSNFLNILPINSGIAVQETIYKEIYERIKEMLQKEKLLPTYDGSFTEAKDALLARGKELTEILNQDDLQKLFNKKHWLDTNITYDRAKELRDYLMNELNITEVDFESFARKITNEFLYTKSDEWMVDFYKRLLDQESLWRDKESSKGVLRTKPIIRLENGEHIAPFDNSGKVQVYLPTDNKSHYKTVKKELTKNDGSLKFLKTLGLTEPDLFAEIREFILPKYMNGNNSIDESYFEDFEKILRGYESIPLSNKEKFISELYKIDFIYAFKNDDTNEARLLKASKTYFPENDLKKYFIGYESVYFVSEEFFNRFDRGRVKKFLIELGVEDKPRRIEINANLTYKEKEILRNRMPYFGERYTKDYDYEGLDNFINNISSSSFLESKEKSVLLWKFLLKSVQNVHFYFGENFFYGEYKWYYHFGNESQVYFEAKFLKTLKSNPWLVDSKCKLRRPSEISFSELSDTYPKECPNIYILKKLLGFKPEIMDQLPEDDRRILEIAREKNLTPDKLERILSKCEQENETQEVQKWTPERMPHEVSVIIKEIVPDNIEFSDLRRQKSRLDVIGTRTDKKSIGRWGEEYVYIALKHKYKEKGDLIETVSGFKVSGVNESFEIIWLNKEQEEGKGYDFVITRNDDKIEFIEVKSKIEEDEKLIEVTGVQWEFARELFDKGEGDKYVFYVVKNAGKDSANIKILKNPIKLWKEGKLYAHPINFRL